MKFDNLWTTSNQNISIRGMDEGLAPGCPSTNNGLESINSVIKEEGTYRERVPLRQYFGCILKLLQNWSRDRNPENPGSKCFQITPSISNLLISNSYTWAREHTGLRFQNLNETSIQFISPVGNQSIRREEIDRILGLIKRLSWKKFESYFSSKSAFWIINFQLPDWISSTCSCPTFKKEYICKHIVGICIIKKTMVVPDNLKTNGIGSKPKRGRKKFVGKALVVD